MLIFIRRETKLLPSPKRWSKGSTIFVAFGSKMGLTQVCCMPFKQASQQRGPIQVFRVVSERNKMHFYSYWNIGVCGADDDLANVLASVFWIFAFSNSTDATAEYS